VKLSYERRSVGQSVLSLGHRSEPAISFSVGDIFRHLRVSCCEAPSLTRKRVCNLFIQVLLGLASAFSLRFKSRRTRDRIVLSHLRLDSLSVASNDSQGYGGGILSRLQTDAWTPTENAVSEPTIPECAISVHITCRLSTAVLSRVIACVQKRCPAAAVSSISEFRY
jgi:hypothetical protein